MRITGLRPYQMLTINELIAASNKRTVNNHVKFSIRPSHSNHCNEVIINS